jgi:nicotinamidase-related amidase
MFESNPDLATSLRTQGIEHLLFVGLQTDYCVRASILGAIASGFDASNVTLLRGTHSTYDNASTGKSYQQVKQDVEQQLMGVGVCLQDWEKFSFLD